MTNEAKGLEVCAEIWDKDNFKEKKFNVFELL